MKDPRIALVSVFFASLLGACNSQKLPGCASTAECPTGHVCESRDCLQLCQVTGDCGPGQVCEDELCRDGTSSSGLPAIESITGNSLRDCSPGGGGSAPCLGNSMVVTGSNLPGATFTLQATDGGNNIALSQVAATGFSVDLRPNPLSSIREGTFTLAVTNSAGTASQAVTLLQGEPGTNGTNGTRGPTGVRGASGPSGPTGPTGPGGGGGGAGGGGGGGGTGLASTLYFQVNSGTPSQIPISSDRYVVEVTKTADTVTTAAVNQQLMVEMCGDDDGCQMELGTTGMNDGIGTIVAAYMGPPCRLFLQPAAGGDYDWAISPHCYQTYHVVNPSDGTEVSYAPYTSDGADTDGAGSPLTVLNFLKACLLSEAAPNTGTQADTPAYQTDTAAGFYLTATDYNWWRCAMRTPGDPAPPASCPAGGFTWDGAERSCKLVIID